MKLRQLRGSVKQTEVLEEIKKVDKRVDIGLLSKIENYIALPTPIQLKAICAMLDILPSDIYSAEEVDLLSIDTKIKPKSQKKSGIESNVYNLAVRIDKETCKWLNKEVLAVLGFSNISHYIRYCVEKLQKDYEIKIKKGHEKSHVPLI